MEIATERPTRLVRNDLESERTGVLRLVVELLCEVRTGLLAQRLSFVEFAGHDCVGARYAHVVD